MASCIRSLSMFTPLRQTRMRASAIISSVKEAANFETADVEGALFWFLSMVFYFPKKGLCISQRDQAPKPGVENHPQPPTV